MKEKFLHYYMGIAKSTADLSSARKKRVGAVIVKDDRVISIGYNGMPSGWDNECEHLEWPLWAKEGNRNEQDEDIFCTMTTKPEVLHAEANAIAKVARSSESCLGADLFVTCTPCMECAKLIYQCGINNVYYHEDYVPSKGSGMSFLQACGIHTQQI